MAADTATLDRSAARQRPAIGFGATLASEWTKLFSTRSTYLMLVLAALLGVGMTALLSLAVGSSWNDLTEADRADWAPIGFSLVGLLFGGILLTVIGVLVVSSEYTSGMIRLTLAATPQRGRLLAAKVVLVSALAMVATLVLSVGVLLAGKLVLGAYDVPTFSLGDSDAVRAIILNTLTAPLYPLIGMTFAFLFRSSATPITLVLALMFVPSMFGSLFPQWWQENILSLLPGSVADSIALSHLADSSMYLSMGPAVAVFAGWLAIAIGISYVALTRRDA